VLWRANSGALRATVEEVIEKALGMAMLTEKGLVPDAAPRLPDFACVGHCAH
jgi:hypothetical protein